MSTAQQLIKASDRTDLGRPCRQAVRCRYRAVRTRQLTVVTVPSWRELVAEANAGQSYCLSHMLQGGLTVHNKHRRTFASKRLLQEYYRSGCTIFVNNDAVKFTSPSGPHPRLQRQVSYVVPETSSSFIRQRNVKCRDADAVERMLRKMLSQMVKHKRI